MRPPAILALATATPPRHYRQNEILAYLQPIFNGAARHASAIFERAGVAQRAMAADEAFYREERGTQKRNERYLAEAMPLGETAIRHCLTNAGCEPKAVDDFIIVSCTGFEIPGLDLRLAGHLNMRPDLRRACILGMGCYGAFPGLVRAREAVIAQPNRLALVLAIELCSLHLQTDNSLENLVVSALFGDGAAAVLIGQPPAGHGGPRLLDAETYCDYTTFEHMAFQLTDHGFQMRLSAYVPDLLAAQVEHFIEALLQRNSLRSSDIRFWGIHPGGSKILDYVQTSLKLSDEHMAFSRSVLREHGNMSSPTILFVLDEIQRCGKPEPGDYGVLMAFGPGLTLESALVRW